MSTSSLLTANAEVLRHGARVLERTDDDLYARPNPLVFDSTIGGHIRHIVDHVECCVVGLTTGRFDYEFRRRDPEIESSRGAGLRAIDAASWRLARAALGTASMWLRARAGDPAGPWVLTSCDRELEFLHSHTVHHYALIAVLCRLEGMDPDPHFGVAPSTLRHRGALPEVPA